MTTKNTEKRGIWKRLRDYFSASPVYVRRFIWDANSGRDIEVLVEADKIIRGMRISEAKQVLERRAMKCPRFLRNWYLRRHAWLLN